MVTKYTDADWIKQVEKPNATLSKIIGTPVKYFAYPFGLWNEPAVEHMKKYGFTAAFKLAGKNSVDPKYTIARQIIDGAWDAKRFMKNISRKGLVSEWLILF
jgi:peptidoglycan/xylan/chitin deacetylase (PgdA/CDA1 family)